MQHSLAIYRNSSGVDKRGWGTGWDSPIISPAFWVCIANHPRPLLRNCGFNCGFKCGRNCVRNIRNCVLQLRHQLKPEPLHCWCCSQQRPQLWRTAASKSGGLHLG